MIVLGSRVVIPKALRRDMRFSSNAPRRQNVRAHQVVDYHYARCDECVGQLPSQARELFKLHESVKRSSEQVHVDVITFTKSRFLVLIEQFSSLLHVVLLPNNRNTARHIIDVTVRLFLTTFGISIKFWSDHSPFFFQSRLKRILAKVKCGNQYISSPYYAQLNWFKEGAIKLMKKMTANSSTSESFDEDKFSRSIFLYKNAQTLNLQSNKNELEKGKQVYYYNPHKQYLTLLKIDAHVLVQHLITKKWSTQGVMKQISVGYTHGKEKEEDNSPVSQLSRSLRQDYPKRATPGKPAPTAKDNRVGSATVIN
ncbi:hypothetical protein T4B_3741 [Trichinella pseudospiralis]|uniref:Integrase catalytic domain-containing protein n=1 Tax=Trichinella pseudospiralis TaxID=6337 RepID=A0A0V1I7Z4_TRIPS|nr:hypothetical protein T4B_3741 [Trichinella pseudospiralis]KRZ39838.1 hypothetical protein T4C_11003 [Trichinella pseudospiralis]